MKPILKFAVFILLTGSVVFISCSKDGSNNGLANSYPPPPPPPPPPPLPPPSDTLSGSEFLFSDLIWLTDVDGSGLVYISVENRPDLFSNPGRPMEVSIRLDTSTVWIQVANLNGPSNNLYRYNIYLQSLFVFVYVFPPPNYPLAGTRVSIKVKFL